MVDLHTLPGDAISEATDINIEGLVIGVSFASTDFSGARAFIYQNGIMTPLNNLISASDQAKFFISSAGGINDFGQIAAQANIVTDGVVADVLHAVFDVGYANDYTFAERPCRPSDRIECHRDIARVKQAIQL